MGVSLDQIAFIEELFAPLGPVTHRKMMGGLSIYLDGQIFSIMDSSGTVYLKASGEFAREMAASGSEIFCSETGKTMGYWTLPDDALDDPENATEWARKALKSL